MPPASTDRRHLPVSTAAGLPRRNSPPARPAVAVGSARAQPGGAPCPTPCPRSVERDLRALAALADEDWALALIERHALVHPGYFYDFDEESLLVVSLLPREQDFAEGMRRIAARFSAAL